MPILMYHVVGTAPAGSRNGDLYVSRPDFLAQVRWLAAHGYSAVTLDRLFAAWRGRATLPPKPIVLSFDDGYPQDITTVLPILRARRWPAVLFLQIGNLVPARVRQLLASGWEIDAHTFTHPDLTTIGPQRLRHEVAGSRAWIRNVFRVACDFFAYPAGRYDAAVVAAVRAAGFDGAVTTNLGFASPRQNPDELDRVRVAAGDAATGLATKLRGLR